MDGATIFVVILAVAFLLLIVYLAAYSRRPQRTPTKMNSTEDRAKADSDAA